MQNDNEFLQDFLCVNFNYINSTENLLVCLSWSVEIISFLSNSCWLAIPEDNDYVRSPFLWSFILPMTIILIGNVVILIIITVKVLWKNNQNLKR